VHGRLQDPLIELRQPQLVFNNALVESIDETLTELLGRAVVDALYVHLQTFHSISRGRLPHELNTLLAVLERIFGILGAQTITNVIARKFYFKLGLKFTGNPSRTLLEYVDDARMKLEIS
jgi:hypothetical protein